MIFLTITSILLSFILIVFTVKKLANIGNGWLQVAEDRRVKNNTKYQVTQISVKHIRFYIILIIGVIAVNWLFIYSIIHPEILK